MSYLLIDIENSTVSNLGDAVIDLRSNIHSKSLSVHKIGLSSKDSDLLKRWEITCKEVFSLSDEQIFSLKTYSGSEAADMGLCFIGGIFANQNSSDKYPFILVTEDKVLGYLERYLEIQGIICHRFYINKDIFKSVKQIKQIEFNVNKYPFNYEEFIQFPSLIVKKTPNSNTPIIKQIQLPDIGRELTFGREGADINVDYWDKCEKSKTIYETHVSFIYSEGLIFVRSAMGFRRGQHAVVLNDKILSSKDGNIKLFTGDILKVGGFIFELFIPKSFSKRKLNKSIDVHTLSKNIEIILHQWVRDKLTPVSEDWWHILVSDIIRIECDSRNNNLTEHSYNFVFLREIEKIIISNWQYFEITLCQYFLSKTKFREAISKFITIRNKVMHPTRAEITSDEYNFINNLEFQMTCVIGLP